MKLVRFSKISRVYFGSFVLLTLIVIAGTAGFRVLASNDANNDRPTKDGLDSVQLKSPNTTAINFRSGRRLPRTYNSSDDSSDDLLTPTPTPNLPPVPSSNPSSLTNDFVITVKTNNGGASSATQFTIPTTGGGYNYNVDCNNDGTNEATAQTGDYTCSYGSAGTYTVRIKDNTGAGTGFPRIFFDNGGDRQKLLTIEQWGTLKWTSMENAFYGCTNLAGQASDAPDLSGVTSMASMFHDANSFNQNIGNWNTASVTNMSSMFLNSISFNQPIGSWNTASVTDMSVMFAGAFAFNQPIGNWNTANVTNMSTMFSSAFTFNQNIGSWNTAKVVDMSAMFNGTSDFNQNIGSWNTANVTTMRAMFFFAQVFNQNIGGWNTGKVTDMAIMFAFAPLFDQNLGNWNVTALTDADQMFSNASLSTANYDALLIGWDARALQRDVQFDGGSSNYCAGAIARSHMMSSDNWIIVDLGMNCPPATPPDLTIIKTHTGNFAQGQTGAQYTITVTNSGGSSTSGTVTVVDTLPAGLTATAISGTSWACTLGTLTCTRGDALAASASYPAITLTVNVAINAASSVTNSATVSGGGETNTANDTATNPTTILVSTAAAVTISGRVTTQTGRGISNARVTITEQSGNNRTATTNPFGYFRFTEVQAGETYIISVISKRYSFAPRVLNVIEDIEDLNYYVEF